MKKIGFTLAEVLLTLAIIGVVSTMTVPSLISSIDERELQAQAKKAYNTLQNAISQKQALTEMTPEDVADGRLIEFLAGKTGDKVQVLKYNQYATGIVQLPDGIIMGNASTGQCGDEKNTAVGQGKYCLITVDINGEAGPNFSAMKSGTSSGGAKLTKFNPGSFSPTGYLRSNRDIVHFRVDRLNVIPDPNSGTAQRYIQGIRN